MKSITLEKRTNFPSFVRRGREGRSGLSPTSPPLIKGRQRITVAHIITKMELGGAQQNTLFTVSHLDRAQFHPILITGEPGLLDEDARNMAGVELHQIPALVRRIRPLADVRALFALTRLLRRLKPD